MKTKEDGVNTIIEDFWTELKGNSLEKFKEFVEYDHCQNKFVSKVKSDALHQAAIIISVSFAGFCLGVASELKKLESE